MSGGYLSNNQKEKLIELVSRDPELVGGKFSSSFTFKESQRRWMAIADQLNAIEGATKDFKHWRKTWQDLRSKAKLKNITLIRAFEPEDKPFPNVAKLSPSDEKTLELIEPPTSEKSYVELDDTQVEFDFVDLDTLPTTGCSKSKGELSSQETSSTKYVEAPRLSLMEELPIRSQQTSNSTNMRRRTYQQRKSPSNLSGLIGNRSKTNRVTSDSLQFQNKVIDLLTKHVECTQNYHDKNLNLLMKQVEFTQNYQMQKLAILTRQAEANELTKSKTNL